MGINRLQHDPHSGQDKPQRNSKKSSYLLLKEKVLNGLHQGADAEMSRKNFLQMTLAAMQSGASAENVLSGEAHVTSDMMTDWTDQSNGTSMAQAFDAYMLTPAGKAALSQMDNTDAYAQILEAVSQVAKQQSMH